MSLDPKGFAAGDVDLYRYVDNSATNLIDPSGLDWLDDYSRWFYSGGRPRGGEGLIPIWGAGRAVYIDIQEQKYASAALNGAAAASDVFLFRALASAAAKGLWKVGGSHTWKATSSWLTESGWRKYPYQEFHHWLIPRAGWGRRVPDWVKNQPWNLRPFAPQSPWHDAIHGGGPYRAFKWPARIVLGVPGWAQALLFTTLNRIRNVVR